MKLYTAKFAPNPRKVEIFLKEKGIKDIERVVLDMMKGEHRTKEFRAEKNPLGLLPVLELDDGSCLTETAAICEYLEELYPEPTLYGDDALQRARTREASRLGDLGLMLGAGFSFQHSSPFFAGRGTQEPVVAEIGKKQFASSARRLDGLLAERTYLAGEIFTMADITVICAIDFGKVSNCVVSDDHTNLHRWMELVRERPSCSLKKK